MYTVLIKSLLLLPSALSESEKLRIRPKVLSTSETQYKGRNLTTTTISYFTMRNRATTPLKVKLNTIPVRRPKSFRQC